MGDDEEYDKLFRLDKLLGELDDMEDDIKGKKKRKKRDDIEDPSGLPDPVQLESPDEKVLEDIESDASFGEHPPPDDEEECESCTEAARKFVEDRFCSLTDDEEQQEACIVDAMKVVSDIQKGKITMRQFEGEIKRIGKKYITDWEPEDDDETIIPEQVKKDMLGDD